MASDNPPYFQVGTNVSARYKGAFCSANVKKVKRKVKVKVQFACKPRPKLRLVMDDDVFGPLFVNSAVRAMDPDVGGLCDATVVQVIDRSVYTVVFNDGDVSTLSRSGVCTPGQRHYNAKDNLDNFPLLDPKAFSSPVMAGNQQVPTELANRRLSRSQTIDNVLPVTPVQSEALNLTSEVPSAEVTSSVMRSCRKKRDVATSSNGSPPRSANRPKVSQRNKNQNGKIFPAPKTTRRKVLGFKKHVWRARKMNANGTGHQANGYGTSKVVQRKLNGLTEPAILEVIDGIKKGSAAFNRKIAATGSSILRYPISENQVLGNPKSAECVHTRPLFQRTNEENASKRKAFSVGRPGQVTNGEMNKINEKEIKNCNKEGEHEVTNGFDQVITVGNKEAQVLDTNIDLNPVSTKPPQEDSLPCCSKDVRKVDSGVKGRDTGYQRRNTRANAARAFPRTVNDMYKELCVIVDEKKVEVPTIPPVGKHFNFIPEDLGLVTDPKERQRIIMTSLENLCVTYFGIKEHLSVIEQLAPKSKKK